MERDPGSEIVSALLPLCRGKLTSVTWIVLSGIELGETDLDDLIPALNEPDAQLRAVECSRSGLSDRLIQQVLGHLERQQATMECINISDNPGRIHLERFSVSMSRFTKIRKLDLSRIIRTTGEKPLIEEKVLLSWRLEELILNGVPINDKTLDIIAAYLASDMSEDLRVLQMDQCNLNGSHVALLMRAMIRVPGEGRNLELHVSANRLEKGVGEIVKAIEENQTPTHLVVRMIEFTKEDYFRQLLEALRTNTTIRSLDISKASLPYDAGPETCDALRRVFAENETLEELDISGEQAHLEVTRFGIGLNQALTGLKTNKALKVLRIEYQNLGLEGANTLSTVIRANESLTHIFCEHNDISLQGFTILANGLAENHTVLVLPFTRDDQDASMKRLSAQLREQRIALASVRKESNGKSAVLRTLSHWGGSSKPQKEELTPKDYSSMVHVLEEKWEFQMQRLGVFLERNRNIALGVGVEGYGPGRQGDVPEEHLRPTTALSDRGILEQVLSNTTPKVEPGNPIEDQAGKLAGLHINDKLEAAGGEENVKRADSLSSSLDEAEDNDDDTPKKPKPNTLIDGGGPLRLPEIESEKRFEVDDGMFEMEH